MNETLKKEYFKIKELSIYSGISERTLRNLLNAHIDPIPHIRIGPTGRILRVKKTDFDNWMNAQKTSKTNSIDELLNDILN